MWLVVEHVLGF